MKGRILGMLCGLGLAGNVEAGELRRDLNYLAGYARNNGTVTETGVYEVEYKGAQIEFSYGEDSVDSSDDVISITCGDFTARDVGLDGFLTGLNHPVDESYQDDKLRYFVSFGWSNFYGYMISSGKKSDGYRKHERVAFSENPSPKGDFGSSLEKVEDLFEKKVHRLTTR